MVKGQRIFLAISLSMLVQPVFAAEIWKCEYVVYSSGKGRNPPPPLRVPALYSVDGDEMRLMNGVARYKITVDTEFGLMAAGGDRCDSCTGGPLINTEVVTINKSDGSFSTTTQSLAKNGKTFSWTANGQCVAPTSRQ